MTKQLTEQIGRFQQNTGIPWVECFELRKCALRLQRLGERACNGEGYGRWGEWTEKDDEKDDRDTENALCKARAIVEPYGFKVYHQSDPRGWQLYVYKPEQLAEGLDPNGEPKTIGSYYNMVGFGVPQ